MSTVDLTPTVDVRRAEDRFSSQFGWLDSKHSFSFGQHYDPANTHHGLLLVNNDDVVDAGHRLRHAPAPRHGDRHLGARRLPGPPGLHRPQRDHLPGPGPADERRPRHHALGEERLLAPDRGRPHATRCTSCRCGSCPTRTASRPATSSSRSTDELLSGGLVPVASGMAQARRRVRDPDQEQVRRPVRRPAAARPVRRAPRGALPAPVRPARGRHPRGRRSARHRATPSASPRPAARGSPPPSRPRSWCGRCTPPSPPDRRPPPTAHPPRRRTP